MRNWNWLLPALLVVGVMIFGAISYFGAFSPVSTSLPSNKLSKKDKPENITTSVGEVSVTILDQDLANKKQILDKTRNAFEIVLENEQAKEYVDSFIKNGWNIELLSYRAKNFYDKYLEESQSAKGSTTLDIKFKKNYNSVEYIYSMYLASLLTAHKTFKVNIGDQVGDIEKAMKLIDKEFNETILSESRDRIFLIYDVPVGVRGKFYYNDDEYEDIIFSNNFDILSHSRNRVIIM